MAVDEGAVTAKALWAYSARKAPGARSSSPDSAKSAALGKPQRKRASKPKVRTGCLSCKRRHLKCDERKEGGCQRCEAFGIPCEGYASPKPVKETKPARVERLLLPRPKVPAESAVSGPAPWVPSPAIVANIFPGPTSPGTIPFPICGNEAAFPPLVRPPSLVLGWEDEDNFYWSVFQHEIVRGLSPHFESNFWTRLLLKEGLMNDCIRHSILSIGAYYRAVEVARKEAGLRHSHPEHPSWIDTRRSKHHRAALHHHDKALGHLRQKMGSSSTDTRLAMMATLLFIAFENMQGNYQASGSLIRSGIKVLGATTRSCLETALPNQTEQCPSLGADSSDSSRLSPPGGSLHVSPLVSPSAPSSPTSPTAGPSDLCHEDVAEMAQMFARLSTLSVYLPFPHCKFAYHMLLDPRLLDPAANRLIASYPTTLEQARTAWDFYLPVLGDFFQKAMWHNLNRAYDFDIQDAAREQGEHLTWLRRFAGVLDFLSLTEAEQRDTQNLGRRRGTKPEATGPMNRGLEMLKIQRLVATIFITCCLDNTEMLYDAYMPQFGEVLARCEAVIADVTSEEARATPFAPIRPSKLGFCNDAGLLPLLGFVISKCRHRAIRHQALALVDRYDCREGSWDSRSLTNAMAALMSLEEMGTDVLTGLIPATARFVWTNSSWDPENRTMTMQFTRVLPSECGEYEKTELTAGL